MLMNQEEIKQIIPHREPFILVDEVESMEGDTIVCYKNVTGEEDFFRGHFPSYPVMPGVLIMEALAQAAGILSFKSSGELPSESSVFYFAGIDNARFKKPVTAGDQLHLHVEIARQMRGIWKYNAVAKVDGEIAAEAELMCAKRDIA